MKKFNVSVLYYGGGFEDVVLNKVFEGESVLDVFKKVRKDEEVLREVMWCNDEELAELNGFELVDGKLSDEDIKGLMNELNGEVWEGMLGDRDGVLISEKK